MSQDAVFLFCALSRERKAGTFQEQAIKKICLRRNLYPPFYWPPPLKARLYK